MLVLWWSLLFCIYWVALYSFLKFLYGRRLAVKSRLKIYVSHETAESETTKSEEEIEPFRMRVLYPLLQGFSKRLGRLAPSSFERRAVLRLQQAGGQIKLEAREWLGLQLLLVIGGVIFGVLMIQSVTSLFRQIFILMLFGFVPFLFSELFLRSRILNRRKEIKKVLPDVLDLLTVSVEAGLGFDQALMKVVEKVKGQLSDELSKTLQEIQYGKSRRDALKDLSDRVQVDNLKQFINALLQADRLGISIGNVLRVQAEDMRIRRRQEAEEKAMKAPVKLLFPLIFFVFPSLFVILLGPAVINIFNTFLK